MTISEPETPRPTPSRHPGPSLTLLAGVHTALFLAGIAVTVAAASGGPFPTPFASEDLARAFFSGHAGAVRWVAFLQFGSAIPLGLFTATVVSRLRFLGITAAGVFISLFGGLAASFFLALSALAQWVLTQPGVVDSEAFRVLHLLMFATGGPGFVVPFGLLMAGVSITAGITRWIPKWLMAFGVVLAVIAELSSLTLVWPPAAYLLPVARFGGLVWLLCVGVLLPKTRRQA
jgi:hypothetical protein